MTSLRALMANAFGIEDLWDRQRLLCLRLPRQGSTKRPPSERLMAKWLDLRGVNVMRDWCIRIRGYLAGCYLDCL